MCERGEFSRRIERRQLEIFYGGYDLAGSSIQMENRRWSGYLYCFRLAFEVWGFEEVSVTAGVQSFGRSVQLEKIGKIQIGRGES